MTQKIDAVSIISLRLSALLQLNSQLQCVSEKGCGLQKIQIYSQASWVL